MLDKVREAVRRWSMVEKGDCVAVGLSGGADSTALLYALDELKDELGITLRAIHVNHGIRGAEADADQHDAERKCRRLGVELDCFSVNVPEEAARRGIGTEECARILRYECFDRVIQKYGCKVATAHTLSDNAETVLLNLVRGCGVGGLKGIPPVRGSFIRPLILASRENVEEYCLNKGISFVTDSTNLDRAYRRNFIRLDVVPMMKRMNPSFLDSVGRLTASAAEDDSFLRGMAADALDRAKTVVNGKTSYSLSVLRELHPAILHRAVMSMVLDSTGHVPEHRHVMLIEQCILNGSGAVETPGGWTVRAERECLITSPKADVTHSAGESIRWEREVSVPETLLPGGRSVSISVVNKAEFDESLKNDPELFKKALDYDIIKDNMLFRSRREGDSFRPAGRGLTKQLKKLFQEAGIPAEDRNSAVMLEHDGKVAWMEGFGASEDCRVTNSTENVLILLLNASKE